MLYRPEPSKERGETTILSIITSEITHWTRFTLLLLLRIQRYMWCNHVATFYLLSKSCRRFCQRYMWRNHVTTFGLLSKSHHRFCLLTGESVERLPPPDTSDIERTYQDFCESLLSAAKQCIPRDRRKNYVPCWDKECETLYCSFTRATVGAASGRAYSLDYNRISRSDGRKLSTPSISRTPAARRGEQSTNLLAGLDVSLACAPSRQTPSPCNL